MKDSPEKKTRNNRIIIGRNAVKEALRAGAQLDRILVQKGSGGSIQSLIDLSKEKGLRVDFVEKTYLDRVAEGGSHQGILAYGGEYKYAELDEVLGKAGESSVLLVLDEIEDPHNLGAIMRSGDCLGADGIIISKRRSAGLTETVAKTSAGAIEYLPCIKVNNIAATIDLLKEKGYWVYGADMNGDSLWSCDLKGKIAIVIGNEGKGISRLVKEKCDVIVSIPMEGHVDSLNASNAAAIIMYEALKQRIDV